MSPKITISETVMIATKASGIFFVIFGNKNIINIVNRTKDIILYMAVPSSQTPADLNIPS